MFCLGRHKWFEEVCEEGIFSPEFDKCTKYCNDDEPDEPDPENPDESDLEKSKQKQLDSVKNVNKPTWSTEF